MKALWWDLRVSLRSLLRRPSFAVFTAALLALGIGTSTAVFVLLDAVFLHPLTVSHPERVLAVYRTTRSAAGEFTGFESISYPDYLDIRDRNRSFSLFAAHQVLPLSLAAGDQAERTRGMFVTVNYFDLLGLRPERGRFFQAGEGELGSRAAVAVLSHAGWERLFGADPAVVGRTIVLNGRSVEIVGVAPPGFRGTDLSLSVDVWLPLPMVADLSSYGEFLKDRGFAMLYGLGRLKPGVSAEAGRAELASIAGQLAKEYPVTDADKGTTVLPLLSAVLNASNRQRYANFGRTLSICFGLMLFVVCASVGNLLLSRGFDSLRELAIRQAVGAPRWRTLLPHLCDSFLLFLLGGLLSLPVARWSLDLLWRLRPPELVQAKLDLRLGTAAIAFALLLALATCLLFAILPALQALRPNHLSLFRVSSALGERRRWPLRWLPVAAQVALAFVSLLSANLFLDSLQLARNIDLGFDPAHLAVVTVGPGDQGYDEARGRIYYQTLLERVQALPGVRAAGLSENRLLRGAILKNQIYREGNDAELTSPEGSAHRVNVVAPGFFNTVGLSLVAGRDFAATDCATCPPVVIINQTMAELIWPGESAVGKRIWLIERKSRPVEIVGVAQKAKYRNIFEDPIFFLYRPLSQSYVAAMTLHVRTTGEPEDALPAILQAAKEIDPRLPLAEAGTMEDFTTSALWFEHTSALLLSVLGALAVVLAILGVYAAASYSVARRARELGIRLALGATHRALQWLILRETCAMVALGVATGWALTYFGLRRFVADLLHGVDPGEPTVYAGQALVLLAVGLLGGYLSSRRTLKIEPALTLSAE